MSSNKIIYDTCAYKNKLLESVGTVNYNLYNGKYENNNKSRVDFGLVGGYGVSLYNGNLTDLESDLRGQTRINSLCPSKKYHPKCIENCRDIHGNQNGLPCGTNSCKKLLIDAKTTKFIKYKNKQ